MKIYPELKQHYDPVHLSILLENMIDKHIWDDWSLDADIPSDIMDLILKIINDYYKKQIKALIKSVKHSHLYLHKEDANGTELSQRFLKGIRCVNSSYERCCLNPKEWNELGFTQLKSKTSSEPDASNWSNTNPAVDAPTTLLECANNVCKNDNDSVLMFHGTSMRFLDGFLDDGIDKDASGGALGKGFYLTFNPNEAKHYGCNTTYNDQFAMIFECQVSNASQIKVCSKDFVASSSNNSLIC